MRWPATPWRVRTTSNASDLCASRGYERRLSGGSARRGRPAGDAGQWRGSRKGLRRDGVLRRPTGLTAFHQDGRWSAREGRGAACRTMQCGEQLQLVGSQRGHSLDHCGTARKRQDGLTEKVAQPDAFMHLVDWRVETNPRRSERSPQFVVRLKFLNGADMRCESIEILGQVADTQSTTEIPRLARGACKRCECLAEATLAQGRRRFVEFRRERPGVGTVAAEPAASRMLRRQGARASEPWLPRRVLLASMEARSPSAGTALAPCQVCMRPMRLPRSCEAGNALSRPSVSKTGSTASTASQTSRKTAISPSAKS